MAGFVAFIVCVNNDALFRLFSDDSSLQLAGDAAVQEFAPVHRHQSALYILAGKPCAARKGQHASTRSATVRLLNQSADIGAALASSTRRAYL